VKTLSLESLSFALYVKQQTPGKETFCAVFKLKYIIILSTQERKNENVQRKFCQESLNLPFAVPGNVTA
jgi:hypothetical protein